MTWSEKRDAGEPPLSRSPREARERIHRYAALARSGLWALVAFVLMSLAALSFGPRLGRLPEGVRSVLGPAPPVRLIGIALAVYAFSALIYILARMMEGGLRYRGWPHLAYLGGFYLFFAYASALEEHFWAILVAGLTILGLEYYRLWSHCQEAIREERRLLARFDAASDKERGA